MDNFNSNIEKIKEKLGEENSALISEELINIMSEHKTSVDTIETRDKEITTLQKDKEDLVITNGQLFRKLGEQVQPNFMTSEPAKPQENVEIKIGDIINSNGDLIK